MRVIYLVLIKECEFMVEQLTIQSVILFNLILNLVKILLFYMQSYALIYVSIFFVIEN